MARSNSRTSVEGDPPDRYRLGTEAEVNRRDHNTFKNPPTHFQQIGPGDKSANLNEPPDTSKDSNMKFTTRP